MHHGRVSSGRKAPLLFLPPLSRCSSSNTFDAVLPQWPLLPWRLRLPALLKLYRFCYCNSVSQLRIWIIIIISQGYMPRGSFIIYSTGCHNKTDGVSSPAPHTVGPCAVQLQLSLIYDIILKNICPWIHLIDLVLRLYSISTMVLKKVKPIVPYITQYTTISLKPKCLFIRAVTREKWRNDESLDTMVGATIAKPKPNQNESSFAFFHVLMISELLLGC